jgi:tetratricopeptide (TPR) repeat protein
MTDESLFIAALEMPSPAERQAFLDTACAGDPAQRQRLDQLLAGHDQATGILDHAATPLFPADAANRDSPPAERAGAVLAGRYKLIEEIGAGGMGAVWAAEQLQPVRRKVAVKFVKAGMDSKAVLARFEAERQALAVMDHPHIAKVLDGGTTDAGRPFFVMEYVQGVSITGYCDEARLSVADRLALFVPVCQAVQHAHQKGIIHRDLKPSNILVCLSDGTPVPKVIDFGLAKAMHQPLTEHTLHTAHGQMLGTPLYMAPEQAEFNNLDVDTRADVYALGVILYELLTGTTPLERDRLRRAAWDELLRLIREEEPPRPSARLSGSGSLPDVAAQRRLEPVRLTRLVRGELDWIVMKCLEKDRGRRYDTANGLARDVQRYLADEPVEAGPPSAAYRLRKLVRKYRTPLLTAAVVLGFLVAGVVTLAVALVTVNRERLAKEAALDAEGKRRKEARAALDAMSSQVTEDWLATQPELLPQHRHFLEQTLRFYEQFAADTGQDEESRAGVAQAYFRVGSIREKLAEWKDAEQAWERSRDVSAALAADFPARPAHREIHARVLMRLGGVYTATGRPQEAEATLVRSRDGYRRLVADFPADPAYRHNLGKTLDYLGVLLNGLDRLPEAAAAYGEGLEIHRRLVADFPADPDYRYHLAQTTMNLGYLHDDAKRLREAEEAYRQAVGHFDRLATEYPRTPHYLEALATTRTNLGITLAAAGKPDEAEEVYRQALKTRRQLVAQFPAVAEFRQGLATNVNNLGSLLDDTGRAAEAGGYYDEAVAIHQKLAADFPEVADHQNDAAGSLGNLAHLKLLNKDFAAARRLYESALPYHRAALTANPDHPAYRTVYRNNRWQLAETLLGLRDHAAAAESVAEFLRHATDPPHDHHTAAALLAGCVKLAAQDERHTDVERQALTTAYGDRATAALRRAVELRAEEVVKMKTDPLLDPLRSRDDFKTLLAEWEKQNPPKPEVLPAPRVER